MSLESPHFRNNSRLLQALENAPALRKGDVGYAVRLVQQALLDLHYPMPVSTGKHATVDGIYGDETKGTIRQFQRDAKGLAKDGVLGKNTLSRLDAVLVERKIRYRPLPPLPPGSPGGSGDPGTPDGPKGGKDDPPPKRNPHKIAMFLNVSPRTARTLVPAAIEPFHETDLEFKYRAFADPDVIRKYMAAAVRVARMTRLALNTLASHSDRETLWNSGFERWWFGDYSERKFRKVQRTFDSLLQHLTSPSLRVICDSNKEGYASATPGVRRIKLGMLWVKPIVINPNGRPATLHDHKAERVQTFVHEAAHIAGRTNGLAEGKHYGRTPAHSLAGRGMKATRSADSYGYYAIDIATEGQHRHLNVATTGGVG